MNIKTPLQTALKKEEPPRVDKLMALLGGTIRLDLIRLLLVQTESVSALAEKLDHSIGLVSHNLKLLREQGIVLSTRAARHRFYSLAPGIVVQRFGSQARLTFTASEGEKVELIVTLPDQEAKAAESVVKAASDNINRFTNVNARQ